MQNLGGKQSALWAIGKQRINKKNRLYKKFTRSPPLSNERKYKTYKNKLDHLIRIAKRKYHDTKFVIATNGLRTTWKLLDEVINKR